MYNYKYKYKLPLCKIDITKDWIINGYAGNYDNI